MEQKVIKGHCENCGPDTNATLAAEQHYLYNEDIWYSAFYRILKCLGCGRVYFQLESSCSEDCDIDGQLVTSISYYPELPKPNRRNMPSWLGNILSFWFPSESNVSEFPIDVFRTLQEVYDAVNLGILRLAAMGIRSVIEGIMIDKVMDHGTFTKNLDKFQEAGYLSIRQRNVIDAILDAGHAAMHRGWEPKGEDIDILLEITESVIQSVYFHEGKASNLERRIPPRRPSTGSGRS
jgi:DNA-binding PadR family transcriptional regulator